MMMKTRSHARFAMAAMCISGAALPAAANHHLMQIHQVIGGVNGDTSAQAVQLRMRAASQHQLQLGRLWAHDANGANPVLLIDFDAPVVNHGAGVTVLVTTAAFDAQCSPTCVPDFTMNPIPDSYLAAGSLTFENNSGTQIWWRLSWGGDNYTGPTTGSTTNDLDGDFGFYLFPLPTDTLQALLFQGAASARSTNNADDYDVTPGAAVFTNNAGDSFTVVGAPAGVCPDSGTILNGTEQAGSFGDVCDADDARWVIQSTTFAAAFSPAPVAVEFDGNVTPLGAGSSLTRHDYHDQGFEVPPNDGPMCEADRGTTFCRGAWHWQVVPNDGCWRLGRVEVSEPGDHQPDPIFSCNCAKWRPGEDFPPKTECQYAGQLLAYEPCSINRMAISNAKGEWRAKLIEDNARKLAKDMTEDEAITARAEELARQRRRIGEGAF